MPLAPPLKCAQWRRSLRTSGVGRAGVPDGHCPGSRAARPDQRRVHPLGQRRQLVDRVGGLRPGRRTALSGHRGHQLAEQADLPVRGGPVGAQVARLDAELGQPGRRRGDLERVGVVAAAGRGPQQPVLLQARAASASLEARRVVEQLVPAEPRPRPGACGRRRRADCDGVGSAATVAASVAPDCSRITRSGRYWSRWAVSTSAAARVGPGVLAVAGRRPPRLDEALGLQEPQLRDGHVGELGAQLREHLADAHQALAPGSAGPPRQRWTATVRAVAVLRRVPGGCRRPRHRLSSRRAAVLRRTRGGTCRSGPRRRC